VNADNSQTDTAGSVPYVMPVIHVEAARIEPTAGMTIIDKEMIESLPSSDGNLTDLLKTVPSIQFSEDYENSKTGGEIRPAEISIAGGRPEDNNYLLDGTSNNSLLDPTYSNISNESNIPGHSQEMFILDHLIESIKVLRANIPVRYGGFSGGVVDTKTIDPATVFGGSISYNMTRSTWGKFHISPDDQEDFYNSTSAENQPNFTKYSYNTTVNFPLNEKTGILFDYARLHSKIPLHLFDNKKIQYRNNENIFLKFVSTPQSGTDIKLSATYAPYEGSYYLKDTLYSNYKLIGGGWKLNGQLNQETDNGNIELTLNYQESFNSREAPANWYSWRITPSKSWGKYSSMEGGYGDIEKQQKSFTTHIHFESDPITKKDITHKINAGLELSYSQATFDRTETFVKYIAKLDNEVVCQTGDLECIDGEQFLFYKQVYPEDNASAQILKFDIYMGDTIKKERLMLQPGVRFSYDNFQKNKNLAPRLTTSFDLWRNTTLIGGVGRYYNSSLLTLRLEEQKKPRERYYRFSYPDDWPDEPRPRISTSASRTSKLDTPYADEWTLGLQQQIFGGQSDILYINRNYKKQIVSVIFDVDDDGYSYKEWKNEGRRKYEELSLSWEKKWEKNFFSFNISWQKVKSNSSSYADQFSEDLLNDTPDYVWYNEHLIPREELPPNNFNRPIKANLIYTTKLAYGFSFTNTTNFRARYKALMQHGTDPSGIYDAYTVTRVPSALTCDWKIIWKSQNWKNNKIECSLDILNVFDRKISYGEDDGYLLGRQFWAGITYNF